MRSTLIAFALIIVDLLWVTQCAAGYSVGTLGLLQAFPDQSQINYVCFPRLEFAETNSCTQRKKFSNKIINSDEILIDSSSLSVLYASENYSMPTTLDYAEGNLPREISKSLSGSVAKRFLLDSAVVLIWGDVRLEAVSSATEEYDQYKPGQGAVDRQLGLLVNSIGDFKMAKSSGRPLYRVIGGNGLIVLLSETAPRHVVVQRLIVAAGTLSEKKFKSQAREFLAGDRNAPVTDNSKWPKIAFAVRRLALDTTEADANKIVDEVFVSNSTLKYRSHIWAFLPTSVIKHLRNGTYLSDDIFGERTDFPEIREKIFAQLKENPAEPFSEFLLYTIGIFDEAIQFNKKSPISTILNYASAHSKLRQLMAALFQNVATATDPDMLSNATFFRSYLEDLDPENLQFLSAGQKSRYKEAIKKKDKLLDREAKKYSKSEIEINAELSNRDFFHGHAYETIAITHDNYHDNMPSLSQYISYLNEFPERYDSRPLVEKYTNFITLTDHLLLQFDDVLKDRESPHYDDAAYFSGWLQYHRGNLPGALTRFELAIALTPKVSLQSSDDDAGSSDHTDYGGPAVRQVGRILRTLLPEDALNKVRNNEILSLQPSLWYGVLDALYVSHNDQGVMDGARIALSHFGVTIEDLPVTTDPKRIDNAFTKLKLSDQGNLKEIVYLYNASRESQQLKVMLLNIGKLSPRLVENTVEAMIIKYALTKDSDLEAQSTAIGIRPRHKDLRQGIYLAQASLDLLPKSPVFGKLRDWLHYKRITLLAQFDPVKVPAANIEFQAEFPTSSRLNDGIAEQVFGEAIIIGDMAKATASFRDLVQKFPEGNAVDNAYSWIAIGWTCAGKPIKALAVGKDIVRLFPLTRHAIYARHRSSKPNQCSDMQQLFNWDHNAMNWRQRTRIDLIQHDLSPGPH